MTPMTERLEKALAAYSNYVSDLPRTMIHEAQETIAAYREARALPDDSAERDAVIEAAKEWRALHGDEASRNWNSGGDLLRAVDALAAKQRPRAEVWENSDDHGWTAGTRREDDTDSSRPYARFYGPNARQHAEEFRDKINGGA